MRLETSSGFRFVQEKTFVKKGANKLYHLKESTSIFESLEAITEPYWGKIIENKILLIEI